MDAWKTGRAALDAMDAAACRREYGDAAVTTTKKQRRQRRRLALRAVIAAWKARKAA